MTSDAQKKASAKYRTENVHQFNLKFFPKDEDVYWHLNKQPKKAEYLIGLIRRDMEDNASNLKQ